MKKHSNTPEHVSLLAKAVRFSAALLIPIVQATEANQEDKTQELQPTDDNSMMMYICAGAALLGAAAVYSKLTKKEVQQITMDDVGKDEADKGGKPKRARIVKPAGVGVEAVRVQAAHDPSPAPGTPSPSPMIPQG